MQGMWASCAVQGENEAVSFTSFSSLISLSLCVLSLLFLRFSAMPLLMHMCEIFADPAQDGPVRGAMSSSSARR